MADPRAPVIFIGAEVDAENLVVNSRGETRHDARIILSQDDVGRIKAGYVCARCFEAQETPFPKECYLCKFPMADRQSEFVAKGFQGNIRTGPQSKLEDEFAAMEELEKQQKRVFEPSQILLPGKDFAF